MTHMGLEPGTSGITQNLQLTEALAVRVYIIVNYMYSFTLANNHFLNLKDKQLGLSLDIEKSGDEDCRQFIAGASMFFVVF